MKKNFSTHDPLEWSMILKALADDNRLKIIHVLLKQDSSVNNLADVLGSKAYNISKHLKILETSGLVSVSKDGNRRIYKIADRLRARLTDNNQELDLGCCKFIFKDLETTKNTSI